MNPSQPTFQTLRLAAGGAIAHLTLDRPGRLNAIDPAMLSELAEAAAWLDRRREVKVVVVGGAGRSFCAGFDLDFFRQVEAGASVRELADRGRVMAEAVANMRPLTIAAVHGRCVGGGLVIAAACDLRLAADDAVFSIPEVDLGIPLAWGGIPRLVREIGPALTKELVLGCREVGAAEAAALRLVNKVVPAAGLLAEAEAWAAHLAGKASQLLEVTKRQVNAAAEALLSTAGAVADADAVISAMSDRECREAAARYLATRKKK